MSDGFVRRKACKTVEEVLHRYRGPMLQRSTVYETDMRVLADEIKRLRAQFDADPEPPSGENITGLCSVCGGATNQLKRRGTSWVCVGCWQEDAEEQG